MLGADPGQGGGMSWTQLHRPQRSRQTGSLTDTLAALLSLLLACFPEIRPSVS